MEIRQNLFGKDFILKTKHFKVYFYRKSLNAKKTNKAFNHTPLYGKRFIKTFNVH
jgi:hypothetical protein